MKLLLKISFLSLSVFAISNLKGAAPKKEEKVNFRKISTLRALAEKNGVESLSTIQRHKLKIYDERLAKREAACACINAQERKVKSENIKHKADRASSRMGQKRKTAKEKMVISSRFYIIADGSGEGELKLDEANHSTSSENPKVVDPMKELKTTAESVAELVLKAALD
jgi:hypothetical protein